MNDRYRTCRAVILPLAVVSMAMVMPAAPVSAEQVIDQTVRRAESITTQITQTVRDLCGDQVAPVFADRAIEPIALPQTDDVSFIAPPVAEDRPAPAVLPTLIDLPPPHFG